MKYNHKLFVITAQPEVTIVSNIVNEILSYFMGLNYTNESGNVLRLNCLTAEMDPLVDDNRHDQAGADKVVDFVNYGINNGEQSTLYFAKSVEHYKKIANAFSPDRLVNIIIEESLVERFKEYVKTIDYSSDEACLKCLKHFLNSNNKYAKHQTSKGYKRAVTEGRIFKCANGHNTDSVSCTAKNISDFIFKTVNKETSKEDVK